MGIDTSAKLMVGLERGELDMDYDELNELLDEEKLDRCPTYYDGYGDDCEVVGVCLAEADSFAAAEVDMVVFNRIDEAKALFKKLTGQEAKLLLAPHVW